MGYLYRLLPDRDVRLFADRSICFLLGAAVDGGADDTQGPVGKWNRLGRLTPKDCLPTADIVIGYVGSKPQSRSRQVGKAAVQRPSYASPSPDRRKAGSPLHLDFLSPTLQWAAS